MLSNFERVKRFNEVFRVEYSNGSEFHPDHVTRLAQKLIHEEVKELDEAIENGDGLAALDAIGDILYVAYGFGDRHGWDVDGAFAEIDRSNLSKLDANGNPVLRSDGKVKKGPMYSPPDLRPFI